jgi:hypothetical protein
MRSPCPWPCTHEEPRRAGTLDSPDGQGNAWRGAKPLTANSLCRVPGRRQRRPSVAPGAGVPAARGRVGR